MAPFRGKRWTDYANTWGYSDTFVVTKGSGNTVAADEESDYLLKHRDDIDRFNDFLIDTYRNKIKGTK